MREKRYIYFRSMSINTIRQLMDSLVRNYLITSNLFTIVELVHHQMANFSAVNTTDASSDKDTDADTAESLRVTIALVIGIGLSAIILGCIGFFLCREYAQQKGYHNHRQLVKLNQSQSVGRYLRKKQSEVFAEEEL